MPVCACFVLAFFFVSFCFSFCWPPLFCVCFLQGNPVFVCAFVVVFVFFALANASVAVGCSGKERGYYCAFPAVGSVLGKPVWRPLQEERSVWGFIGAEACYRWVDSAGAKVGLCYQLRGRSGLCYELRGRSGWCRSGGPLVVRWGQHTFRRLFAGIVFFCFLCYVAAQFLFFKYPSRQKNKERVSGVRSLKSVCCLSLSIRFRG